MAITIIVSVIGWIITIIIAVCAVKSSAKDTDKKLAALEESTTKQIESVKELTKIQIELSILQGNMELRKIAARHKNLTQKVYDESKDDMFLNQHDAILDSLRQKENRRRDLIEENDMALNELKETHELLAQLNALKKRIGGE